MISAEQRARIRRLFFAEHWKVGTIAAELGLHHDAVSSALETHRFDSRSVKRPSVLDPYKALIVETLEQHPRLRATRLFEMVRARGYAGSVIVVRRYVREVREWIVQPPGAACASATGRAIRRARTMHLIGAGATARGGRGATRPLGRARGSRGSHSCAPRPRAQAPRRSPDRR